MDAHPNKQCFIGVLTLVDTPSDKSPAGARGHRVILTRAAAEASLPSLIGMGVDYRVGWDGHDNKQKFGVIDKAYFRGDELLVEGHLWQQNFPRQVTFIRASEERFGMSYELHDARVEDLRADVWVLTKCTFVGAAVLLREKAAYKQSEFCLV